MDTEKLAKLAARKRPFTTAEAVKAAGLKDTRHSAQRSRRC